MGITGVLASLLGVVLVSQPPALFDRSGEVRARLESCHALRNICPATHFCPGRCMCTASTPVCAWPSFGMMLLGFVGMRARGAGH